VNSESDIISQRFHRSILFRILPIGALILLLQIPIISISSLIGDRQHRAWQAEKEVSNTWGKEQLIAGPVLNIPYEVMEPVQYGSQLVAIEHQVRLLPQSVQITGEMVPEVRTRGLFDVLLYQAKLKIEGRFARPDFQALGIDPARVKNDKIILSVGISDPRAIRDSAFLQWKNEQLPFRAGTGRPIAKTSDSLDTGIHVRIPSVQSEQDFIPFSFDLELNGSGTLQFVPVGAETTARLNSTWPSPSFSGSYLPRERSVSEKGFDASWKVLILGRGFPESWVDDALTFQGLTASSFGVSLISPVDARRMTQRAVDYELMFVFLTFLTYFLFEILCKTRIHGIQYLFVGSALCLFYLLLLSLSEYVGLTTSYLIASSTVVVLVSCYSLSVLKAGRRAAIVTAALTALYGYLYVLLQLEDYSLLAGSLGLTLILALTMYLTRNIDWYRIGDRQ